MDQNNSNNLLSDLVNILKKLCCIQSYVILNATFRFLLVLQFFFFLFLACEPFIWFFFARRFWTRSNRTKRKKNVIKNSFFCLLFLLIWFPLVMLSLDGNLFSNYYFCSKLTFLCRKLILFVVPKKTLL